MPRTWSRRSRISSRRISHGWQYLALFLVIFHFAVPFLLLLSRDLKRMPHRLVWVALALLVVRYIDLFMLVSPEFDADGREPAPAARRA